MRLTRRHALALLLALTTLVAVDVAPVGAITLQRTWSAKIGSGGVNGKVVLRAYTNGVGQITMNLKGLKKSAKYSLRIRNGTCGDPGTSAKVIYFRTTSSGTFSRSDTLMPWDMTPIWTAARNATFIARLVSGTSNRCGKFTFPRATRVAISSLNVNLPVIRGSNAYPKCRVAMYAPSVAQPREPGYTFIYAHARTGMFLPLLTKFRNYGAAGLIGRVVKVWTSDSYVSYYKIVSAQKTQDSFGGAYTLDNERLRLQTSTGPNYTYPKLIADAVRYKTVKTTYAASHPTPHPVSC
jgi:hypothetical protein